MRSPLTAAGTRSAPGWLQRFPGWWFTVAVLVAVAAVRLRLADIPLERDEGEYAYTGQLMLQGIPPYQLAYSMKFPGAATMYALVMAVFGQTPAGIHLGVMCLTTLTALMLYWLGKKILDPAAGMVAATTYAMMAATPDMMGLEGHATHFAAFFVTGAMCLMWKARQEFHWLQIAASGFAFGLAILMKQHAALIAAWALVAFAAASFRRAGFSAGKRLAAVAAFGAAVVLPFALCCLLLWMAGVFPKFWLWTVGYARQYETLHSVSQAGKWFGMRFPVAVSSTFCLWLLAILGLILIWFGARFQGKRLWLAGFAGASALTVVPGFYFRLHYFLLVLPAVALLAACGMAAVNQYWRERIGNPRLAQWPVIVYGLLLAAVFFNNRDIWLVQSPVSASSAIYTAESFTEAQTIAAFIRSNSPPDARVAVLGSEPEIYFLAGRHSATGYIYTYELTERQPFARQMTREMIREVETNAPEFVVFVENPMSWDGPPGGHSSEFNSWWAAYRTQYDLIGLSQMASPAEVRWIWGPAAAAQEHDANTTLELYRRKHLAGGPQSHTNETSRAN
jgi:4-amino-4-deoxy-L-arabinose transferase-like glycosyltransferase